MDVAEAATDALRSVYGTEYAYGSASVVLCKQKCIFIEIIRR